MAEDIPLKIILLGEAGVGKTSVLFRFKNDEFKEYRKATFIDHYSKRINVRGVDVDLCVWDTAGQETFRSIVRSYYRHADGVLLLYDVTDVTTFHILTRWLSDLRLDNEMSQIIIAGNKNEDPAKKSVAVATVKNFARDEKLEYMEVSAKSGANVEKAFHRLAEKILIERGILPRIAENNLPPPRVEEPAESAGESMHVQGDSTEQQTVLSESNTKTPEKSLQSYDQRKESIQLSDQRQENIQLHYQPPECNTRNKKKGCC